MTWGWTAFYIAVLLGWLFGRPSATKFWSAPKLLERLSTEAHPFMPYLILLNLAVVSWGDPVGGKWFNYAVAALNITVWLLDKDGDDRWKKRRKRLGDRVKSLGHRLVTTSS